MTDSLKEQLMKLGFKSAPRQAQPSRKPQPDKARHDKSRNDKPRHGKPGASARPDKPRPARPQGDIDLAKAFAIRAQKEKDERIAAEQQRQEEARLRRESTATLTELLARARLNLDAADIARHFDYGGKIRRIHVTAEQLKALNAGELAVVQMGGRYHLVSLADGQEAERILPGSLALQVDPNAPPAEGDYADPMFQVPDDLVW